MRCKTLMLSLMGTCLLVLLCPSFIGSVRAAAPVASLNSSYGAATDRTQFQTHLGFAFYAFHRFVYVRFQSGSFTPSDPHAMANIAKAATAMLFVTRELKKADSIAKSSSRKVLRALMPSLNVLIDKANAAYAGLKGSAYTGDSASRIQRLSDALASFSRTASHGGLAIKDVSVVVSGAA